MRLTIPHYYDFGADRALVGDDLVRPEAWDGLRTQTAGPFALPAERTALERAADERDDLRTRARAIGAWLDGHGVSRLASYGVGGALLEVWLHRETPERELVVTDYAPKTVERLAALLPEMTALRHDLLVDAPVDADLHLFHRIDTELTDAQWRDVFKRFAGERVLVVATEVIDLRRVLAELRGRLRRRGASRAGWIRTRRSFESLWSRTHRAEPLRFADLDAWVLEPRR